MFSRIGVIGSGAMGRGIVQVFATSGCEVLLYDVRPEAVEQALSFNKDLLARQVAKGKLTPQQALVHSHRNILITSLGGDSYRDALLE